MALVLDTGPLYASLDSNDADFSVCRALLEGTTERLVVPAPVLIEVDQLVLRRMHPGIVVALLDDIARGAYEVEPLVASDYTRIREFCDQYRDTPVGFVDAAVLAVVERLGETKLATLDHRHFAMMRPRHVDALELLPH